MDLLQQELNNNKKNTSNGKKIVLILLIVCVLLLIMVIAALFILNTKQTKPLTISIDGENVEINNNILISDENGNTYISLQRISPLLGYNYLRGEYLEYIEDNNKCYLENTNQVVGFEAENNEIYKVILGANTDYQYYKLKNIILKYNDTLYISLEDLNNACNVVYTFLQADNKITINTPKYLAEEYKNKLLEKQMTIESNNFKNQVAMSYDLIVVLNSNGKMGAVDSNLKTVIGSKYSTMEFDEFSQNFIVSDDGKYGIISKEGKALVELKYQDLKVLNYSPLLYEVKQNNKFGVLDEKGNLIVNIEFDKIGTQKSSSKESVLLIDNIEGQYTGIVVSKNAKYGIVNINTGKVILDCNLENIYSEIGRDGEKSYYVVVQNNNISLEEYIKNTNTTVLNIPNE